MITRHTRLGFSDTSCPACGSNDVFSYTVDNTWNGNTVSATRCGRCGFESVPDVIVGWEEKVHPKYKQNAEEPEELEAL
jgi:Zn ribbon nucleic-acid-binding protein